MRIIYFDICALPLFLMILFICYFRKMTKGNANTLFIALVLLSLVSAVADLGMEIPDNMVPLSATGFTICSVSAYVYLALRNATIVLLLLFLLELTHTMFLLRPIWVKIIFSLPYAVILATLAQNIVTNNAFTVTAQNGYTRGPLILIFYGVALIYGLAGFAYCIYCRRYLPANKWGALLGIYVLVHLAVVIQFFHPELLVEMFFTAMGEMLITLIIMRPEERMDSEVGMLSWVSYQNDLRNVILSGEHVQIIVIRMMNAREIRNYMGDHKYHQYVAQIADEIRTILWEHHRSIELYYERPDTIYLIMEADKADTENIGERLLSGTSHKVKSYEGMGARLEPRVCLIRCPEDLNEAEDIISLGHKFHDLGGSNRATFRASEVAESQSFVIETHIEEILDRAIREHHVEMYYQPIFDVHTGKFNSAEALARIIDPEYGMISPGIFIPAAEEQGLIVPIGDMVLDQVFRFISEHELDDLDMSYIDINLSVAQCMESSLPEKIDALQRRYGVDPAQVNLEITETTFENINEIMLENVNTLIQMGYRFTLDDYGTGYSNIQRINHIPLQIIKIDKSMLDESSSDNGRKILEYTVRMMKSIGKKLVAEGAESVSDVDVLKKMDCDFIQGFYFSRPLPETEFIRYMREQNRQSG